MAMPVLTIFNRMLDSGGNPDSWRLPVHNGMVATPTL